MRSLTCRELIEFLWAYLDGEVTGEERRAFDVHLAGCPTCVAYLQSYQQAGALARRAFAGDDGEIPAEVPPDLVKAVLAARDIR